LPFYEPFATLEDAFWYYQGKNIGTVSLKFDLADCLTIDTIKGNEI